MDCKQNLHHDHVLDKHIGKNFLMPIFRITLDHAILPIISTASFWFPNSPHVLQQQQSSNCLIKYITVFQVISRTWSGQTFLHLSSQSSRARTSDSNSKIKQRLRMNSCIQRKPSTQSPMAAYQVENDKIHRNYKTVTSSPTSKTEKKSPFQGNYRELNLILKPKS